ncbi:hypothetical protein FGO68_gene17210 [Halteria grandinella]|uniref:Uncharacterized protein n=1 Tax=Halteria grandinella TaxID=5974 RepID=A0A8J8P6Q0_HALGN|nr:hypothetical protein FGO68_gene17210 [Halteria grandinella]
MQLHDENQRKQFQMSGFLDDKEFFGSYRKPPTLGYHQSHQSSSNKVSADFKSRVSQNNNFSLSLDHEEQKENTPGSATKTITHHLRSVIQPIREEANSQEQSRNSGQWSVDSRQDRRSRVIVNVEDITMDDPLRIVENEYSFGRKKKKLSNLSNKIEEIKEGGGLQQALSQLTQTLQGQQAVNQGSVSPIGHVDLFEINQRYKKEHIISPEALLLHMQRSQAQGFGAFADFSQNKAGPWQNTVGSTNNHFQHTQPLRPYSVVQEVPLKDESGGSQEAFHRNQTTVSQNKNGALSVQRLGLETSFRQGAFPSLSAVSEHPRNQLPIQVPHIEQNFESPFEPKFEQRQSQFQAVQDEIQKQQNKLSRMLTKHKLKSMAAVRDANLDHKCATKFDRR